MRIYRALLAIVMALVLSLPTAYAADTNANTGTVTISPMNIYGGKRG